MSPTSACARIARLLSPPSFESEEQTRIAKLVNGILLVIAAGTVLFPVVWAVTRTGESRLLVYLLSPSMLVFVVGLKLLLARGHVRPAGTLLSLAVWAIFTLPVVLFDGIRDVSIVGYFLAIVIASLVSRGGVVVVLALLASASLIGLYAAETSGALATSFADPPATADLITLLLSLNITALLAGLTIRTMAAGEASLRQERDRAQSYLDIAGVLIVALDTDGRITLVNRRGAATLGRTEGELLGRNWFDTCIPERNRKDVRRVFTRLMTGECDVDEYFENPVLTAKGEERLIAWHNGLLRDASGDIVGTLSSGNDVTERRRTEEALRESERQQRTLLGNLPGMAYRCRNDSNWTMLFVSEGCRGLTGYAPEELIEDRDVAFGDLIHPEDREGVWESVQDAVRTDRPFEIEYRILTRKNEERWLWERGTRVSGEDGGPEILEGFISDITERRALEFQLRQTQKLESIGALASGVAHEINSPLMGMINYAELISDDVEDPKLAGYAAGIVKAGDRVATIVRNLLAFSRPEREANAPAVVRDMVDASLSLTAAVLRKSQITVKLDVPHDLPLVVCRSRQIEQVLINLLTNARDALNDRYPGFSEEKTLSIEARAIEREAARWIRITVEDHGSGIPEEAVGRIFDPFYTTKARDQGTGLGLSVSYGIVTDHHGELTVESEVGRFTRFRLDLPLDTESAPPGNDAPASPGGEV